jgi:hypothetical protein
LRPEERLEWRSALKFPHVVVAFVKDVKPEPIAGQAGRVLGGKRFALMQLGTATD